MKAEPESPTGNEGDQAASSASLPSLMLRFLIIGAIGFGGGMAVIALMERDLVLKRRLLPAEEFLHGVGFSQLLGPFAVNTAFFVGCRLFGPLGGLLCAGAFMVPSVLLVILLSWLYFAYHSIPSLQAAVQGVGPVVIALIVAAAWSLGRKALRSWPAVVVALLALALSLLKVNAVYVLATAGALGLLTGNRRLGGGSPPKAGGTGGGSVHKEEERGGGEPGMPQELPSRSPVLPIQAFTVPGASQAAAGTSLAALVWTFLKVGLVFFGGGFVLIPILHQKLVTQLHWLNNREFLDGVAISNLTPGPIAVLATFAGYHLHGVSGALAATLALFAPAMALMTVLTLGYVRFKGNARFEDFLAGVSPAVAGLIVGAAVLLGPSALHGLPGWALMALALLLLLKFKVHPVFPLAAGALLGAAGWLA
ncbi:MAG: chromate efflux transporter [Acidobacteriota bacterium]